MTLRYKVPVCYISEGDTRKTVEFCLSYLTEVSEEAYRTLMAKYGDVFQQIQERSSVRVIPVFCWAVDAFVF
jgi:hypoxanthine phosphoribosyltransferase